MAGENILFSAAGYDKPRSARCLTIAWGIQIIASEDQSRTKRAMYPRNWSASSFGVVLEFAAHDEYEAFSAWMKGYMDAAANPDSAVGSMRVQYPTRDFDYIGVLSSGVSFGDRVDQITWQVAYNFVGGRATAELNLPPGFDPNSQFSVGDKDSSYYYPAGVGGLALPNVPAEDQVYGTPTVTRRTTLL